MSPLVEHQYQQYLRTGRLWYHESDRYLSLTKPMVSKLEELARNELLEDESMAWKQLLQNELLHFFKVAWEEEHQS